jgi:hypothetical protein
LSILDKKEAKMSLALSDIDIDDSHWYAAKNFLKTTFKGR